MHKKMFTSLRYEVTYEWLIKFKDIKKLRYLNSAIKRYKVDKDNYIAYIEKFYNDRQFNFLYERWMKEKSNIYLKPSLDHIVPISKGGKHDVSNLQFITWFENRGKNDLSVEQWEKVKNNIQEYLA